MTTLKIPEETREIENYKYSEFADLEIVYIPESVKKIGKHAFYNCRNLKKVVLPGDLAQIEDGAFKNCNSLKEIEVMSKNKMTSCIKNVVADLTDELTILIHYPDGDAKILVTAYNCDYEIDINSRAFHEVVYGSGDAYQRCVSKPELSFSEYDFLFFVAKREEQEETLFQLVENRLRYPYRLGEKEKKNYVEYLKAHKKAFILKKIGQNHQEGLRLAGDCGLYEKEDMDAYLKYANEQNKVETMAYLVEYRNQHFSEIEQEFIF